MQLSDFQARRSDDLVKTDLEFWCEPCDEHLCDIEDGDTFEVLKAVIELHDLHCHTGSDAPIEQPAPAAPKTVQVLHVRYPDDGCTHDVFVDGKGARDLDIFDVDPGRGYTRDDWNEHIAHAEAMPDSAFKRAILAALNDNADSRYIDD